MNRIYVLPEDELGGEIYRRVSLLVSRERGGWQAVAAALGLASGVMSVPLALALGAAARLAGPAGLGPTMSLASTSLFFLTLPLLAAGACLLDLLEKKPPTLPLTCEARLILTTPRARGCSPARQSSPSPRW
jgi:hypothetical protein